jgi:hypothetical protein
VERTGGPDGMLFGHTRRFFIGIFLGCPRFEKLFADPPNFWLLPGNWWCRHLRMPDNDRSNREIARWNLNRCLSFRRLDPSLGKSDPAGSQSGRTG